MSGEPIELRWPDGTTSAGTLVDEHPIHGYVDIAVHDGVIRVLSASDLGDGWIAPTRFNYFREEPS
jgi:hypothetical protein